MITQAMFLFTLGCAILAAAAILLTCIYVAGTMLACEIARMIKGDRT